jgi:GTPase SAR1 family protein
MPNSRQIRIGLIGPTGAGKTTLAKRFADSNYIIDGKEKSTSNLGGVMLSTSEAKTRSKLHQSLQREFNLDIVQIREIGGDTRNQELVRNVLGQGPKGKRPGDVDVVMLVADLSPKNPNAMNDLQSWMDSYNKAFRDVPKNQRPPIMLIGARSDQYQPPEFDTFLGQQAEEISDEFTEFANKNGLDPIIFTSAKTGKGIEDAFAKACDLILKMEVEESQQQQFQEQALQFNPAEKSSSTAASSSISPTISTGATRDQGVTNVSSLKNEFTALSLHSESAPQPKSSAPAPQPKSSANSIFGAITGGFLGALTSLLVHNPLFCLYGSLEKSEWKQWGALNVVRVLISPIVNPIAAVIDGLMEGGAMGYRGGVREAVKVPGEVLVKAPFFADTSKTTVEMKDGTGQQAPLVVQVSKDKVFSHQESATTFGRFFQLPSKFQTSSEKRESELAVSEKVPNTTDFEEDGNTANIPSENTQERDSTDSSKTTRRPTDSS